MLTTSSLSPSLALDTLPPGSPRLTVGRDALAWAARWLIQPNGPRAGQPWRPTQRQARFALWWYAIDDDGRWLFNHGARRLAKGSGKALALDTPLPTPTGWTTMGDIRVGDNLIDETGRPTRVIAATPVMHGHDCYRVTFRDGTRIVADADHLWPMDEFCGRSSRIRRTVTTAEMFEAGMIYDRPLTIGTTKCSRAGVARWRSLATPSLAGAETDLPLPAYLLGYWLGDGDRDCPRVTIHRDDLASFVMHCKALGVEVGEPKRTHGETYRVRFGRGWARAALRDAGLLHNKHIPPTVFRASRGQRLDVLRGLLDSDGTADLSGRRIEFCVTDRRLADGFVELARTLGLYPRMSSSPAAIAGRVVGTRYRVNLTAYQSDAVFALPRKAERLRPRPASIPYSQVRTITSIERVTSVPVRCVTVSGRSSLYLAGDGMVPTHNSPMAAVFALMEFLAPCRVADIDRGRVLAKPVDLPLVEIAATAESQTANTMRAVRAMAPRGSAVAVEHGLDPGKTIYYRQDGGELRIITSSATAAEGAETTAAIADETEHWLPSNGGIDLADVLDRNLAKSGSRMWETANAWEPGTASVAERTWDAWVAQQEGRTRGGARILYDALIAPHDTDLADPQSLQRALDHIYADCPWVDRQVIRDRIWDPRTKPDVARRFYLNQPTAPVNAWLTPQQWAACADPAHIVPNDAQVVLFFDGSKSGDATALIGCEVESGHVFTVGVWEPTEGEVVPVDEVNGAVARAFDRWQPVAFFADVREWEDHVKTTWPALYGDRLLVWAEGKGSKDPQRIAWDMRGKVWDFTRAVEMVESEVLGHQFTHDGDSRVARHVGNARRRGNRWGYSIGKESPKSPRKIDAAVCVVGARMVRRLAVAEQARHPQQSRSRRLVRY